MTFDPKSMSNAPGNGFEGQVERAAADFKLRTLERLESRFAQLVYLASLRDHNTGRYHHYGLESQHGEEAVDRAIRQCHGEVFEDLLGLPLKSQTDDLASFFESLKEERARLVDAWERLRSYQILPPEGCPPVMRELFDRNLEIMLKVLRETDLWPLLHDPHRNSHNLP